PTSRELPGDHALQTTRINLNWRPTQTLTQGSGTTERGTYSFGADITFQFAYRGNDSEHRLAHRRRGIEVFGPTRELHAQRFEESERFHEEAGRTGEAVEAPDQHYVELALLHPT